MIHMVDEVHIADTVGQWHIAAVRVKFTHDTVQFAFPLAFVFIINID